MTLETNTVPELKAMAKAKGLTGYSKLNKLDLIRMIKASEEKTKSTIIKEIAKEQGIPVVDVPMTQVSDWEDMQGVPVPEDTVLLATGECDPTQSESMEGRFIHIEASPKSSDELWEEATAITEEVLEQPKGSMRVMNRRARRRAEALLRRKMKRVA